MQVQKDGLDFDVAIIGGGPAGSSLASYLAKAGLRPVVLERERFPREHVGESLVPATTRVFKEIGFLHKMEEARFPHKFGAAWTTALNKPVYNHSWDGVDDDCRVDIEFAELRQEGVDQNYTYHVNRQIFDQLLLEHAEELGATAIQEAAVNHVDFSNEDYVEVTYRHEGAEKKLRARMVADASGRRTFLGNKLGLKVTDEIFDQYAVHTWFEGFERESGKSGDFIYIHFLPVNNTWVWQIPINDTVTSFGVVTQKKNFQAAKADLETFFWDCLKTRPEVYEKLQRARQVTPFTPEGDYSYAMQRLAGDRFVLVGDAGRFVDPIFASGIGIAMNSSRLASKGIVKAFETGDFSVGQFKEFEETMRIGCTNWYRFITLYYRLNVLYTFLLRDENYRYDMLRLLQGDVWDEEPPALRKMEEIVRTVESNPKHVWHNLLGTLSIKAFDPSRTGISAKAPAAA